ncbi:unnamed protein product [Protopolystoma xenopodis]|uniref:Uncharacterized protein n=1 Tax=Protopolystoma xenopodis TaxID=117903 RepID=A0A3S5A5E7_9PLAT|nr:unnamed protein product [Protopolystoma xenopodis]
MMNSCLGVGEISSVSAGSSNLSRFFPAESPSCTASGVSGATSGNNGSVGGPIRVARTRCTSLSIPTGAVGIAGITYPGRPLVSGSSASAQHQVSALAHQLRVVQQTTGSVQTVSGTQSRQFILTTASPTSAASTGPQPRQAKQQQQQTQQQSTPPLQIHQPHQQRLYLATQSPHTTFIDPSQQQQAQQIIFSQQQSGQRQGLGKFSAANLSLSTAGLGLSASLPANSNLLQTCQSLMLPEIKSPLTSGFSPVQLMHQQQQHPTGSISFGHAQVAGVPLGHRQRAHLFSPQQVQQQQQLQLHSLHQRKQSLQTHQQHRQHFIQPQPVSLPPQHQLQLHNQHLHAQSLQKQQHMQISQNEAPNDFDFDDCDVRYVFLHIFFCEYIFTVVD